MTSIIRHVVLIPDGNRRYATARGKNAAFGHEQGMKAVIEVVNEAKDLGIPYFTIWGASADNITKRTSIEVDFLFRLFEDELRKLFHDAVLQDEDVRVRVIGRWRELFPASFCKVADDIMASTREHSRFNLSFLLGYSGVEEMTAAIATIARDALTPDMITPEEIRSRLWTAELPQVDLVIRTGGEPHWSSGFMMWHTADSQFVFTEKFCPEFGRKDLREAVSMIAERQRRFGK